MLTIISQLGMTNKWEYLLRGNIVIGVRLMENSSYLLFPRYATAVRPTAEAISFALFVPSPDESKHHYNFPN